MGRSFTIFLEMNVQGRESKRRRRNGIRYLEYKDDVVINQKSTALAEMEFESGSDLADWYVANRKLLLYSNANKCYRHALNAIGLDWEVVGVYGPNTTRENWYRNAIGLDVVLQEYNKLRMTTENDNG